MTTRDWVGKNDKREQGMVDQLFSRRDGLSDSIL